MFGFANDQNITIETQDLNITQDVGIAKEDKLLFLNIATSLGVVAYGIEHWGYSTDIDPHTHSEGWFSKGTDEGGADKFGHAYTGYVTAHMFSAIYEYWGYDKDSAALNGAWSSFLFTSIMEVGDSFSDYGLSYEDMVVNSLGAVFGYYTYKYPELSNKIDYRVEYPIHKGMWNKDFMTDYEELKYMFAIKADGFDSFQDSKYLKYIELYIGYFTRGFASESNEKVRSTFLGVGLNLSKLFDVKILEYYQIPRSYIDTQKDF
jgi:hypothetical protein